MNAKKVPQLFASTGATKFGDPKNFPWTMGFNPSYDSEARVYAQYILKKRPSERSTTPGGSEGGDAAGDRSGALARLSTLTALALVRT
jgi:hypothetical protein